MLVKSTFHVIRRWAAFTLVELLLVVAILGMVATASLLVVSSAQDQTRYDETRERYEAIKTSIFGPPSQTLNGAPLVSGYAADVGALPALLEDLRTRPNNLNLYAPIGPASKGIRLSHGWRGPYLSLTDPDLRDSWGNLWHYATPAVSTSELLEFASRGRDGLPGGTGAAGTAAEYDADFPPTVTIPKVTYEVTGIPMPRLQLKQSGSVPRVVSLGVIKAGLNLNENYSAHESLVKNSANAVVTLTIPAAPDTVTVPAGLSIDLGLARQFQLGIYDPDAPGDSLEAKLIIAHPQIFTALPQVLFVEPTINPQPMEIP